MVDLDVYLGRERVGRLHGPDDAVQFVYDAAWLAGGVAISHRLPVRDQPFDPAATRVFFDGLLPEATLRIELARAWRCDPLDTYALLAAIGRESAGAISVVPAGETLPPAGEVDWCDEQELAAQIARLPTAPFASGPTTGIRISLGGAQDKLVLVRDGSRWGLPHPGTPSTHIAKPDPQRDTLPHLALNEFVCCKWAEQVGIPVAETDLMSITGRRVLVSTRFDRSGAYPDVTRLHQEDFAQITGRLPIHKYEQDGGPSVAECLGAITEIAADPIADRRTFVDAVWINALLGNADAHAKNYAMLLTNRAWRLAPLYDVNCTLPYEEIDHGLAMRLDGESSGRSPSPDHLPPDALERGLRAWGYTVIGARRRIATRFVELADRVLATNPSQFISVDLSDDEQRHLSLLRREVHRRSRNLRGTAAGVVS